MKVPQKTTSALSVGAARDRARNADLRTCLLVACVAAASLGLELIQTRILSFLYYNHVVYLTVTVALLGFGISGVFVSLFSSRSARPERAIALLAGAFVISSFACLGAVSRIPQWFPQAPTIVKLVLSYVALTVPFFCSGGVLGWIFMLRAKAIGRLYAIDLACSSGAVMAFLLLLWPLGGDWFVWLCTGLACAGFLIYSGNVLGGGLRLATLAVCVIAVLLLRGGLIGKVPEAYKTLARAYTPGVTTARVEATEWTPITRIDLWSDTVRDLAFGTPSPDPADSKMITQDADAFTMLWGPHHVAWALDQGRRGNLISALSITYLLNKQPQDALVIGVGGGLDMVMARAHGAKHITGVEINPATVALDQVRYRDWLQWPKWDGVTLVRAEGRNYLRAKQSSYDTIVMSGVDTFSALNSGAYVLSENYLYTVEAVQDYLRALKPNGTAAIYRWFFFRGPRESLRLAGLFREAAERMGIHHPEQSIMVVAEDLGWSDYRWAATLIKKRPFTPAEVAQVQSAISGIPRLTMVYMPKVFPSAEQAQRERREADRDPPTGFSRTVYNRLLTSEPADREQFVRSYQFRINPVYDDRPFFFEYYKPGAQRMNANALSNDLKTIRGPAGYYVLYILLGICGLMCVACILAPLWAWQRRGLETPGAVPLLLFFACLGAGYMLFEVGSMQVLSVFIGDPTYSLALVLAGLLVSTGIGAALSTRFSEIPAARVITFAAAAIAIAMVAWLALARLVNPGLMQLPLAVRAAITLAGLLPVGVLLGFPFPTAVKALEKVNPHFIAWAWGVNGVTSVLASIVAIVVAMRIGFSAVVCIAAAVYWLALAAYRWSVRAPSASSVGSALKSFARGSV
jgi:SAM-dependent methyltransferase